MLRNRPFLELLRPAPSKGFQAFAPSSKGPLRRFQPLRNRQLQQRSLSSARSRGHTSFNPISRWRVDFLQRSRNSRWNSNKPTSPTTNGSQTPQSISQRFRDLSRRYGYAAVGVYLGLSVLDFPFCFLTVRLVGPERIGEVEHAIVDAFWNIISVAVPSMGPVDRSEDEAAAAAEAEAREAQRAGENGHKHNESASIWTQLLLAYGVHKSLIFFRVPLTAAVTPKVVKTLRSWGWNIGRPAKRVTSSTS